MSLTTERNDSTEVFRRVAEIALAGLLHDVGKIFQRAEWPLSQIAEKLQDDLCPVMDGRAVHRHVLWTYDFCNDNLKWLAEYVDLARVMRLATGHHRAGQDDPAALILDAADRIAAGAEAVEVEELQPVIPPQVPLESILWNYTDQAAAAGESAVMKSRRRRRSSTSEAAAERQSGRQGEEETRSNDQGGETADAETRGRGDTEQRQAAAEGESGKAGEEETPGEAAVVPAPTGEGAAFVTPLATDEAPADKPPVAPEDHGPAKPQDHATPSAEQEPPPSQDSMAAHDAAMAPGSGGAAESQPGAAVPRYGNDHGPAELPRFDAVRRGFFTAQVLRSDEDVLPSGRRPEMNEQNYRELGTDLIAAVQKIGRMAGKPRLEWLIESLRSVLESRLSLVPACVGSGGQTVSLYSHAVAMSAVAASLWQAYERTGVLPATPDARPMSLTLVQVVGVEEYLNRPAPTENSSRVYHGRAALVRLIVRLLGDVLLREMGLPTMNRLYEGDDSLVVLGEAGEPATRAVQNFIAEQGAKLLQQTGGYLQLAAAEPLAISYEQFGRGRWGEVCRDLASRLGAVKARLGASTLQDDAGWREEAAVLHLTDRHGQTLEPGEWARLQEAYERQLGTNLARGKAIAVYSSPVTPTGVEGEATAVGPWFLHVAASPEGLLSAEGLEQIYTVGEAEEAWAWVPVWRGLPHGPTYRRADESQLRADAMPSGWQMAAGTKRRDTAIDFEELGWLARRSRKGRGFAGRSWLGCLELEADGLGGGWSSLVRHAENLGQVIETARQGQWFWQGFVEGQLRRADRATWRVFVLRSGLGKAVLVGPWNTMMVLAGRAEQWWRRWAGPTTMWPVRGALAFGPRDVPAWQLIWQADEGLIQAEPAEEAARVWVFDRVRNWNTYREALRLSNLFDEQVQTPELTQGESGVTFLRRLVAHEREAQRAVSRTGRAGHRATVAWRSELSQDVRKLLLRHMPRHGMRTAAQDDLIEQLQALITTGRRGKLPASVGLAARIALWQNQGESS